MMPDDSFNWYNDLPEPKRLLMTPNADHSMATGLLEIVPAISSFINLLLHKEEDQLPSMSWSISESDGTIVATLDDVGDVHEASLWYAYSCGNNVDGVKRRDFRLASLDNPCECGVYAEGYCVNGKVTFPSIITLLHIWLFVMSSNFYFLHELICICVQSRWTQEVLQQVVNENGERTYTAHVDPSTDGTYVAYFIDVKYDNQLKSLTGKEIPKDLPRRLEFTTQVSVFPNTYPYEDCEGAGCKGSLV
jgi:hypothetical protein